MRFSLAGLECNELYRERLMKVLIVRKKVERFEEITYELPRFSRMVEGLYRGGIEAIHSSVETVDELKDLLEQCNPELVFSAAYAVRDMYGNQSIIHELLDAKHVAYVGSDGTALALALSKAALKDRWSAIGILTPEYFVIQKMPDGFIRGLDKIAIAKNFPYILKPLKEGNSRGISQKSIVGDEHALLEGVFTLLLTYNEILVENYLGDIENLREFTVAMIGNQRQKLILPCEIVLNRDNGYRVITTTDKDEHRTQEFVVEDQALRKNLIALAERAFYATGVRDYARFDVLYGGGKLYAIEVNGQPMVPDAWFDACACDAGLDTDQYLNAIFLAGIVRNINNGHPDLQIPGKMVECLPGDIFRRINHVE
jgi:D-alanine-D-alanine ligase